MLAYDQPITRPKPDSGPKSTQAALGLSVSQLAQLLWRRKTAIAVAGLICACVAIAVGKVLTPKYLATAQLYVDPRELQLVDRELTPRSQDISGLAMVVDSQARLITSNSVLLQVIHDAHLDQDPEFGGRSAGLLSAMFHLFGQEARPAAEPKLQQMSALEALNRHVNVKKTDRTFIVDIDVWSDDPAKAAKLANAIADTYLAETRNSQALAARRATNDLSGRLKELQERLRNAENALAVYKAQNNFVGSQDALISDQQLSLSNQRLAAARAATLDAQAKYDQIEASRRAASDAGAIAEALQSPTIANLRAQYAEARKHLAETTSELGPLHPSLRQTEKQVEDLRRTISEEVDRFVQSAKNDLARARDYETSLTRALEAQKRQSVQLSQASVRLRELERDVEANRDVYQSFLKRSRETEEQESLNTSNARIIGEATLPQRRSFPPSMSLLAMIGLVLGAIAAACWFTAVELLATDFAAARAAAPPSPQARAETPPYSPEEQPQQPAAATPTEKPAIVHLGESDVMRTLGGILPTGGVPDLTRLGWPTLRAMPSSTPFIDSVREMHERLVGRTTQKAAPVLAVMGGGTGPGRSIAAVNVALAAARNGRKVLLVDADRITYTLSNQFGYPAKVEAGRLGWLSTGTKASPVIKTTNSISVLPSGGTSRAADAIGTAIAQARSANEYDLVIIDGPALPVCSDDRKLIELADGLAAVLPASLDINECMDDIIASLNGAERKLIGVIISELQEAMATSQRSRQYA